MSDNNHEKTLLELEKNQYFSKNVPYPLRIKPIPFSTEKDILDPIHYNMMKKAGFLMRSLSNLPTKLALRTRLLIKKLFDSNESKHIYDSQTIITDFKITIKNHEIPVRLYTHDEEKKPLLIFIHGGGFFGGTIESLNEVCDMLSYFGNFNVLSFEYRLSPEFKFPSALHDCSDVLEYALQHEDELFLRNKEIYLAGDSAGGNLVLATLLRERDRNQHNIKKAALIYPVVNLATPEEGGYQWHESYYETAKEQKKVILNSISIGKVVGLLIAKMYLSKEIQATNPMVSPLFANLDNLPPLFIVYEQYDFLRIEIEVFLKKLSTTNTSFQALQYLGLGHGFIEYIGTFPQSIDAVKEIAAFLDNNIDE